MDLVSQEVFTASFQATCINGMGQPVRDHLKPHYTYREHTLDGTWPINVSLPNPDFPKRNQPLGALPVFPYHTLLSEYTH
jgi:hypothetical protein